MKIDSHHHFWKYSVEEYGWMSDQMEVLKQSYLPADLHKELQANGIDKAISVQVRQVLEENSSFLSMAEGNDFIAGVVGWADLTAGNVVEQLQPFLKNPKFKGIRHILQDEPDDNYMLRPDFLHGMEQLQSTGLTFDLLIYPKHMSNAVRFLEHLPESPIVLDHIAKPHIAKRELDPWRQQIWELSQFPNLFCKVSGLVTEAEWHKWKPDDFKSYFDIVFEAFGPERLMYGSDWPVCRLAGAEYSQVKNLLSEYVQKNCPDKESAIFGDNAARFYKID